MFESIKKDAGKVDYYLNKLGLTIEELGELSSKEKFELIPPALKKKIDSANSSLANFSKSVDAAEKKSQDLAKAERDLASAQSKMEKEQSRAANNKSLVEITKKQIEELNNKKKILEKLITTQKAYEDAGADKRKAGSKTGKAEVAGLDLPKDRAAAKQIAPDIDIGNADAVASEIKKIDEAIKGAESS